MFYRLTFIFRSIVHLTLFGEHWDPFIKIWVPRTGKPGMLQSTGSRRVKHDLATEQQLLQDYFVSFSKDRLTVYMWVYFWTPYSVSLIYMSVLRPIFDCFDDCSFSISPVRPSNLFFSKTVLDTLGPLTFSHKFYNCLSVLINSMLGF